MNNHKRSHEKQENSWFTSKLAPSGIPLQGCLAAEKMAKKMKESEAEEKRSQVGELEASPVTLLIEVD